MIVKVTGVGPDGELQPFYIVNPMNVVVNTGVIMRPGKLKDQEGNPIPIKEKKVLVHIGGEPLRVEETIEEIYELFKESS